jgi:hypothetical protein
MIEIEINKQLSAAIEMFREHINKNTEQFARIVIQRVLAGDLIACAYLCETFHLTNATRRSSISKAVRMRIKEKFQFTCFYCKKQGNEERGPDGIFWHIDHVVPRSKGGGQEESNLVLACAGCNIKKRNRY